MVSHRDPYSVLYYSIYIYVTYSIFLEDLDIASYANDTTIYIVNKQTKTKTKKKTKNGCSLDGSIITL